MCATRVTKTSHISLRVVNARTCEIWQVEVVASTLIGTQIGVMYQEKYSVTDVLQVFK